MATTCKFCSESIHSILWISLDLVLILCYFMVCAQIINPMIMNQMYSSGTPNMPHMTSGLPEAAQTQHYQMHTSQMNMPTEARSLAQHDMRPYLTNQAPGGMPYPDNQMAAYDQAANQRHMQMNQAMKDFQVTQANEKHIHLEQAANQRQPHNMQAAHLLQAQMATNQRQGQLSQTVHERPGLMAQGVTRGSHDQQAYIGIAGNDKPVEISHPTHDTTSHMTQQSPSEIRGFVNMQTHRGNQQPQPLNRERFGSDQTPQNYVSGDGSHTSEETPFSTNQAR